MCYAKKIGIILIFTLPLLIYIQKYAWEVYFSYILQKLEFRS